MLWVRWVRCFAMCVDPSNARRTGQINSIQLSDPRGPLQRQYIIAPPLTASTWSRRQVKYLNNVVEADHGKLKLLIRPVRGFKTLKTTYATIKGFEVMRALRKGQAGMFALQGGIVGEARIVECAFGLGPCALTEAMAWLQDRLANAES